MMNSIKNWCNEYQGVFTLGALLVAILALFLQNNITIEETLPVLKVLLSALFFSIKVPLYAFIVVTIALLISYFRVRKKYMLGRIDKTILYGTWKNEWNNNGSRGAEIFTVKPDDKLITGNVHRFNIDDFNVDLKRNCITFKKVGVLPVEKRTLLNVLTIKNNELLVGTEEGYEIKYTKLTD